MPAPFILVGRMQTILGKAAEPLIPAVDALARVSTAAEALAADQSIAAKRKTVGKFGQALQGMSSQSVRKWLQPVAVVQSFDGLGDRTHAFPDLSLDKKVEPSVAAKSFSLSVMASGGLSLIIDFEDDDEVGDQVGGASARLVLVGKLGFGAGLGLDLAPPQIALGLSAAGSGGEYGEWRLALHDPQMTVLAAGVRALSVLDAFPDDHKATRATFAADLKGASLDSFVLSRARTLAGSGAIKLPFQIKMVSGTVEGKARFEQTKTSRLEIRPDGEDLLVEFRANELLERSRMIGMTVRVGFSSFVTGQLDKVLELLGDAKPVLDKIDALLGDAEAKTLMKPGDFVGQKITSFIKSKADGSEALKHLIGAVTGEPDDQAAEVLAETLIETLDDIVDLYDLDRHEALRERAVQRLGQQVLSPIQDLVQDALKETFDALTEAVDTVAQAAAAEVWQAVGVQPDAGKEEKIRRLRAYLTEARTGLSKLLAVLSDDLELSISLNFTHQNERLNSGAALARLAFHPTGNGPKEYKEFLRAPSKRLDHILGSTPSGVAVRSASLMRTKKTRVTNQWGLQILNQGIGRSTTRLSRLEVVRSLEGHRVSALSGLEETATAGKKSRKIELTNTASFALGLRDQASQTVDTSKDGLQLRLTNHEPRKLDAEEARQFLEGLVQAGAVSDPQRTAVCDAIAERYQQANAPRRIGGSIEVDFHAGELASEAICREIHRDPLKASHLAATALITHDDPLRDDLAGMVGFLLGEMVEVAAADFLLTRTDRDFRRYENHLGDRSAADRLQRCQRMVQDFIAAFAAAGALLAEPDTIGALQIEDAQEKFTRLDSWIDPQTPMLWIDRISRETASLFMLLGRLSRATGHQPTTVVSLKMEGSATQRFHP